MADSSPEASQLQVEIAVILQRQQAEIMDCIDHWLTQAGSTSTKISGSLVYPRLPQTPMIYKKMPPEPHLRGSEPLSTSPHLIPIWPSPSPDAQIQALVDAIKTLQHCQPPVAGEEQRSNHDSGLDHSEDDRRPQMSQPKVSRVTKLGARTLSSFHVDTPRPDPVLTRLISNPAYDVLIMVLVILDACVTGWQVQRDAVNAGKPERASMMGIQAVYEVALLAIFMTDLGLRLFVHKWGFYYTPDWRWNIFDAILVSLMFLADFLKVVAKNSSGGISGYLQHASILRITRIARIFKVLRMVRVVAGLKDLRLMFVSLAGAFQPLISICVVLSLTLYIFGIAMVVGTTDYLAHEDAWEKQETEQLRFYFGRVDAAIVSLFEAMAGGISWGELRIEIRPLDQIYRVIFGVYIVFSILGVLNIVTGVFVESALGNSKRDHDLMVETEREKKEDMLRELKLLFEEIDSDKSGTVSYQEICHAYDDDRMVAYMCAIGVEFDDVAALFSLLDRDQEGKVDVQEFISGCMRLHGPATNMEIARVELENKAVLKMITNLKSKMEEVRRQNIDMITSVKQLAHCSALGILNATCEAPRCYGKRVREADDISGHARQVAADLELMSFCKDLEHI